MAQAKSQATEAIDESLTVEDVRTAAWHFMELAAAFEGYGVDAGLPTFPGQKGSPGDEATLRAAVELLLRHRVDQRMRQQYFAIARPAIDALYHVHQRFEEGELSTQ